MNYQVRIHCSVISYRELGFKYYSNMNLEFWLCCYNSKVNSWKCLSFKSYISNIKTILSIKPMFFDLVWIFSCIRTGSILLTFLWITTFFLCWFALRITTFFVCWFAHLCYTPCNTRYASATV